MHGRPRKAPKPEDAAASAAKAQKLRALQAQFLTNHHNHVYTKEALDTSAKLLEVNPEHYTAWNYRKLAVEHNVKETENDPESVKAVLDEELRVVESALRRNFKSYGAWHHRKWVLRKGHSSLDHELRLLDQLQKVDSRNFHAWNYRRFVTALMDRSLEDELKYTEHLIEINFSNYSAWHNRSLLLSELLKKKEQELSSQDVLSKEFNFVQDALFTDPDDQSGWFYHLWLLDQTIKADAPLLLSSWPAPGSDLAVLGNGHLVDHALALFPGCVFLERFPVILYFNQTVVGVSSSTVTIQSSFVRNEDLTWKPLSLQNSQAAQAWVVHLDLSSMVHHSSSPLIVEVKLGQHQGIMSSCGSQYVRTFCFTFALSVKLLESQSSNAGEIVWDEDKFYPCGTHLQGSIPSVSLDKVAFKDEYEPKVSEWQIETVATEIGHFRELLTITDCKIGKITLARLLLAHDAILYPYATKMVHAEEVIGLYADLMKLDTSHCRYYKDENSLVMLQQLTSSKETVLRHCFCYGGFTLSNSHAPICLRLNNLSLSRVGSFDKLLWVQMLDLSNNELHSIEGLEALQLLCCLNLRKNKLCSFTALEPLRLLKSLTVLNISCNEIGLHSIDTGRYLCSSPLSHGEEITWKCDYLLPKEANEANYWEAFVVLTNLKLKQLDIRGNAIDNEDFKSFLVKSLPDLQYLDGEKLY